MNEMMAKPTCINVFYSMFRKNNDGFYLFFTCLCLIGFGGLEIKFNATIKI